MSYKKLSNGFPGSWQICSNCQGDGGSSAYLGDFSMDDMREDPEFAEAYFAGEYDRACPECGGSGKVLEVNVSACTFAQKRELVKQRQKDRYSDWRNDPEAAAERRMGA